MKKQQAEIIENIVRRAHYLASQMVFMANHRKDKEKGDPKVGGHVSASASSIHMCAALHLFVKTGFDHMANKPHASPADHAYNYLLDLFLDENNERLSLDDCNTAMTGLRAFPTHGQPVFQSYHSAYDPDRHNFFPSGTVGIPPVNAGYLAHAYRFAKEQGNEVPDAHFWSIMGDSEFREGSLFEAVPDFAERELGNLTWIVDYNRQSLDGHRITNKNIMGYTDDSRIENTMAANGWEVIQVRHGKKREELFKKKGGKDFQKWLEEDLEDYELQALLLIKEPSKLKEELISNHKEISEFVENCSDQDAFEGLRDFGGHCIENLIKAFEDSKKDTHRPTMIIVHTLKGWGLDMAAQQGNHNSLPNKEEMLRLRSATGIEENTEFARFDEGSAESNFLKERGEQTFKEIQEQHAIRDRNIEKYRNKMSEMPNMPDTLDINLKMASYPHTQWMLGQLTSKLTRIANTPLDESELQEKQRPLGEGDKPWKIPGEQIVYMAPDVGTSTNLNPSMDGKIFAPMDMDDWEAQFEVKDKKLPDLIPSEKESSRFMRFEITEANVMSCMGSYGMLRHFLGIPTLPFMTVYDFFIKRAMDQYFYNLYWKSSFILCGTPAGVTLSSEGAQHGWKSDLQIPNQICWEPLFCQELDWILCDAIKRHMTFNNEGRNGVLIRGVTRGVEQKDMLKNLKMIKAYDGWADADIMADVHTKVLEGGYFLRNFEGYPNYEPGDNVVNILSLGAMGTEALKASDTLLEMGVYANVIVVTSTDLLIGNQGHETNYRHLRETLGLNANVHMKPLLNGNPNAAEFVTLAGRRIPMVSVHDGEPGLMDNIGSVVGVRHESLAVRKHSRCGRPRDIYGYHKIDDAAVVEACQKVLAETALEQVQVSQNTLGEAQAQVSGDWRQLWPKQE